MPASCEGRLCVIPRRTQKRCIRMGPNSQLFSFNTMSHVPGAASPLHQRTCKRFRLSTMSPPLVPRAADVALTPAWTRPPASLFSKLPEATTPLLAIDLETHDWDSSVSGNKGNVGAYGFYNLCSPEHLEARVVQLGWAVGIDHAPDKVKEFLVKPEGFTVSDKATAYHGISHVAAFEQGRPLRDVLEELLVDVEDMRQRGGRLVCHNAEFHFGIVARELSRCGLQQLLVTWEAVAMNGFCTMNPEMGRYVREYDQQDAGPSTAKNTLSQKEMARRLLPESAHVSGGHHSTGVDAEFHYRIVRAMRRLVGPT